MGTVTFSAPLRLLVPEADFIQWRKRAANLFAYLSTCQEPPLSAKATETARSCLHCPLLSVHPTQVACSNHQAVAGTTVILRIAMTFSHVQSRSSFNTDGFQMRSAKLNTGFHALRRFVSARRGGLQSYRDSETLPFQHVNARRSEYDELK